MKSCEMSFIKYLLFIFNLMFAISGIGLIIAGAFVLNDISDYQKLMENDFFGPPIVLIVVGSIIFLIAFFGCFGAIRENYNFLIAFSVCLIIIFIMELSIGIAAGVYKNEIGETFKNTLKQSLESYTENKIEQIAWDNIQLKLECCGVDSPYDWQGQKIPRQCCHNQDYGDELSQYCINEGYGRFIHKIGCFHKLKAKIVENNKIIMGVGIGIAFIQIFGIILACFLAHSIKKEENNK